MKYCWSTDEEAFHDSFDTEEAAAREIDESGWIGEVVEPDIKNAVHWAVRACLETFEEYLIELVSESAENFAPTDEQTNALEASFTEWIKEIGLRCYGVKNVRRVHCINVPQGIAFTYGVWVTMDELADVHPSHDVYFFLEDTDVLIDHGEVLEYDGSKLHYKSSKA
jgi:hypothetical protein